jgi:hypothetical protein
LSKREGGQSDQGSIWLGQIYRSKAVIKEV